MTIHPTAIVSKTARLGTDVFIGPYCCIGDNVVLEDRVHLQSHVIIEGHTTIGQGCIVSPFASLGSPPQHLGYKGEATRLFIGAHTIIKEHVTVNTGTVEGGGLTRVGTSCFLMVGAHVAHDCQVGDHVIMANNATLGGHVTVGDHSMIGGLTAVHQFVTIGEYAMIGGASGLKDDVIPFGMVFGMPAVLEGINVKGLQRHGMSKEEIQALFRLYTFLFKKQKGPSFAQRLETLSDAMLTFPSTRRLKEFITTQRKRALCRDASVHALSQKNSASLDA